ncbi:MAG: arginine--tRNA ligase [Candidatus Gracilibacteria bacterium]|jgi:arginyl-tRNA synthetase
MSTAESHVYSLCDELTSVVEGTLGKKLGQPVTRARVEGADYGLNLHALREATESIDDVVVRIRDLIIGLIPAGITISAEKGFINFQVSNEALGRVVANIVDQPNGGIEPVGDRTMLEFFSPNTNKPMHLGHLRNIALGESLARLLQFFGHDVTKVNLFNDRGAHICKSMLAYQLYGGEATPESTGVKGDHFVGDYYVRYEKDLQAQLKPIIERIKSEPEMAAELLASSEELAKLESAMKDQPTDKTLKLAFEKAKKKHANLEERVVSQAKAEAPLVLEVNEMLQKWEDGDPEVRALWEKMNGWAIGGMEQTLDRLDTHFDIIYFESQTYKLAMDMIQKGLDSGTFERDPSGAVVADLEKLGVRDRKGNPLSGKKVLLRSDGTSVYITQDLAMAELKAKDYHPDNSMYVVADEQLRHFEVLFGILKALGYGWADKLKHIPYGMVDLPSGRMKSREGTVVDADDILDALRDNVKAVSAQSSDLADAGRVPRREVLEDEVADKIGIAAMRYYLLSSRPDSRIKFDPEQSVKLEGKTGPYILYQYVRSGKILQTAEDNGGGVSTPGAAPDFSTLADPAEHDLLMTLVEFTDCMKTIQRTLDQTLLSDYVYKLAKAFAVFYEKCPIFKPALAGQDPIAPELKNTRLALVQYSHSLLSKSLELLGIEKVERM